MTTNASIIGKEKNQVNQADSDFLVGDFTTGGGLTSVLETPFLPGQE
jgi:hypothetical protein